MFLNLGSTIFSGVEQAVELAKHHNLDVEKARAAGLMHDLAKYFKPPQLEMARRLGYRSGE